MFQNPHRPLSSVAYLIARAVIALFAVLVTTAYVSRIRSGDLTTTSAMGEPLFLVAFAAIGIAGTLLRVLADR